MVIVALFVPLAINLQRRATAELETQNLVKAQSIAATLGAEALLPKRLDELDRIVRQASQAVDGRVLVVDPNGVVLADSDGPQHVGARYATSGRPEIRAALGAQPTSVIRYSQDLGQDIMATAVPIQDEGRLVGAVRITQGTQAVQSNVRRVTFGLGAIALAGLAAGLILAFVLAESLSRPLRKLTDVSDRLGSGDLSARAEDVGGASEIQHLGRSFDEMADRLERTVQAQREFVANASHQLRTPLTGIKLRLESAMAETEDADVRRQLEAADREVDRLAEIVERLLVMAREVEEGSLTHVAVDEAVARALSRWDERASRTGSTLLAVGPGGIAQGNATDLDQILDALIDNAITYAPGEVTIESGSADGRIYVAVQDRGAGIPAEEVSRVTDRFYRGQGTPPGGSGLGLAIARQLAEKWGGSLEVQAPDEGGTRVEVRLRPGSSP